VQVDPISSALKAPGINRLLLIHNGLLSNFTFNFTLRRYALEAWGSGAGAAAGVGLAAGR